MCESDNGQVSRWVVVVYTRKDVGVRGYATTTTTTTTTLISTMSNPSSYRPVLVPYVDDRGRMPGPLLGPLHGPDPYIESRQ